MRWRREEVHPPQAAGKTESRGGFLFLPKRIGEEWRWLEWAEWEVRAEWRGHIVLVPINWKIDHR